jgi:alpha-L-fucosidase
MKHILLPLLLTAAIIGRAAEPVDMAKRTEELKNLRWGMFICWSFSTFSGKEWTPGVKDVSFFKATDVDTDQWARTAKEAGMGYILFLTKHHDGFCLWDTKTTNRKVTKAPLGRDVLTELKKSCDKYGIKLALYFSEGEWASPNFPDKRKRLNDGGYDPELKKAQLRELLTQFGPIEYIWFDHAVGDGGLRHADTIAFVKSLQPGCFVGFNNGAQEGADIRLGEMGKPGPLTDQKAAGPHMDRPGVKSYRLAEFTYPILPAHQGGAMWFYSLPKHDNLCLSAESLYKDSLGALKYGNIFSLDVGPDYAGKLRKIDVATLRKVGQMIKNPPPMPVSQDKPAKASSVWGAGHEADKSFDGDEATRWGAAPDSRSGWLEVDLEKQTQIGRAVVAEISYPRTQKFAIEYKTGDAWKPVVTGTTIAGTKTFKFPSVTARYFRLTILQATEVPTIEEFQLWDTTN